jgi:hypothetical protein
MAIVAGSGWSLFLWALWQRRREGRAMDALAAERDAVDDPSRLSAATATSTFDLHGPDPNLRDLEPSYREKRSRRGRRRDEAAWVR